LYREMSPDWIDSLVGELRRCLGVRLEAVVLRRRYEAHGGPELIFGTLPAVCEARENGLRFALDFTTGRNPGIFLDAGPARRLVRERAAGRRVLNLFAYTCGFSVAALAGGAGSVVNVDMNRRVLAIGRRSHELNGLDRRRASFLAHNIFKSWGKLRRLGPFDLVVIDPPARQGMNFTAERHYPRLLRRLPGLITPGAEIVACLNAPGLGRDFLEALLQRYTGGRLRGIPPRAPGYDECEGPERGLSVLHWQVGEPLIPR